MLEKIARKIIRKYPLFPVSVTIEPTSNCNLKCKACRRWYWNNPNRGENLTLAMHKEIVGNIGWVPSIKFIGPDGEPLCNPEINNIIEYNSSKNIYTSITTNGTLLTPATIRFWKKHKVARVVISFDSCDPVEYESIRLGASFSKVEEMCKYISSEGLPLQMNMIVFERNIDKILSYAKFAIGLGASKIYYLIPQNVGSSTSVLPLETKDRINLFRQTESYLKSKKVGYIKPLGFGPYFRTCIQPFAAPYITLDGSIRPCCTMFGDYEEELDGKIYKIDGDKYILGNIYKDSFIGVWNNNLVGNLRGFIRKTDTKEGEVIDLDILKRWKESPQSTNRFEQCRACSWRWSIEG